MLGSVLVTENGGRVISRFVTRRNTAGNVSVSDAVLRCGILRGAAAGELFKLAIPPLGTGIIRRERTEHAHTLHKRGRGENFLFRQYAVVFLHFAVVSHTGVPLGVADEQLGHFCAVPALDITLERVGVVLL